MFRKLSLLFLLPCFLFAREKFVPANVTPEERLEQPWFTGPLLAAGATTIPVGHWNIQPYFFATQVPAHYNNHWHAQNVPDFWSLSTTVPAWIGLTDWMDIQIQPAWSWNHHQGFGGHWAIGDLGVQVEFQLFRDDFPPKSWIPSIKFGIRETMPTGKYRNLDPKKGGTDQGGGGSWETSFVLAMGRVFHLSGVHYMTARVNGVYTLFAPVHVKGFNAYGGGYGTDGTVYPKPSFLLDFGMEVSLTKNWAFAMDLVGVWHKGNKFSGDPGSLPQPAGTPTVGSGNVFAHPVASNSSLSSIQYSIAPAIEYNFNADLGIIFGPWITLGGKNSSKFYSAVLSVNYYQ